MDIPQSFGVFHTCCLIAVILATVLLVYFFKDAEDKTIRRIVLGVWILLVVFEIYKQLAFAMTVENGVADWRYKWYVFPFQFCDTPLYIMPFIAFLKDSKIRDAFIVFFACFTFFAGIVVMIYPNDVFSSTIGFNIQTMVHHGAQVAIGIMLAARYRSKLVLRNLLWSFVIFVGFCVVAITLNEIIYAVISANAIDDTFNMFYFSRHYGCHLPILADVYNAFLGVSKIFCDVFFPVVYIVGFSAVSALFFGIEKGVVTLARRISSKNEENK